MVELTPGRDGLVHISRLAPGHQRVERVEDIVNEGDRIKVRVLNIDEQKRISLEKVEGAERAGQEFYAATVEEALAKASAALGIARDQLDFTVLDRGGAGFLGIGTRDARISVEHPKPQTRTKKEPVAAEPTAPAETRVLLRSIDYNVTFQVDKAGATIGRAPDCLIRIRVADRRVWRRHARIEFKEGAYWLTDLGTSYGTFVNQARLYAPHRLQSGDVIELGATRLSVTLEA